MCEHHDEWQDQPLAQDFAKTIASLVLRAYDDIFADALEGFPYEFCLLCQDGRSEGFAKKEERGDLDEHCEDGRCPKDPAPAYALRDVCTANGSYTRTDPGKHAIDSLALSAFFFTPGVSKNTVTKLVTSQ